MLATNAGGPQVLGNSQAVFNLTVFNHSSTATGDDSLAIFNVKSGLIAGCSITDAFGRGIVLCSADVRMSDNVLVRNPLFRVNASSYALCLCTSNPRAGPQLPQCVYPNVTHPGAHKNNDDGAKTTARDDEAFLMEGGDLSGIHICNMGFSLFVSWNAQRRRFTRARHVLKDTWNLCGKEGCFATGMKYRDGAALPR